MNILKTEEFEGMLKVWVEGFDHAQPSFPLTITPEELQIAVDAWAVTQAEIDSINNGTATPEIIAKHAPKPPEKSAGLKSAENSYITFCKSLGFAGKASTEELEAFYYQMKAVNQVQATEIAMKALALINNVTQNGGTWFGIEWHDPNPPTE